MFFSFFQAFLWWSSDVFGGRFHVMICVGSPVHRVVGLINMERSCSLVGMCAVERIMFAQEEFAAKKMLAYFLYVIHFLENR
jgi:hypothetical protein